MKKRVLHVVSSLADDSGVMHVVMNYFRYIDKEKIIFDFLYFKEFDHSFKQEIDSLGGNYYFLPKPSIKNHKKYYDFFKKNAYLYDAIHLHPTFLNIFILPLAKKFGIKNRIVHSHTTRYSDKLLNSIRNRFLNIPLKHNANWYFACSIAAGEFLYGKNSFLKDGKSFLINNAIKVDAFRFNITDRFKIRNLYNIENNIVIGHIGRFTEAKNHLYLIDIFNKFLELAPNAKLMLIGDGNLKDKIQSKINEYKIEDKVIFTGQVKNVPDYLNAIDLFLMPSLHEGLPIVGVEAQTNGLPIIFSENITREIGLINFKYLSLKSSPEEWANEVYDLYMDTKEYNRNNSLDVVSEKGFSIRNEAFRLESIYLKIMEEK